MTTSGEVKYCVHCFCSFDSSGTLFCCKCGELADGHVAGIDHDVEDYEDEHESG